jgi:hypothetical protein
MTWMKGPGLSLLGCAVAAVLAGPVPRQDVETNPQFRVVKTDRKPGPVMDAETIRAGLRTRDRALYIKAGWIRDPYITLGPDDLYYLTGNQPNENDPREADDPYNIGLGKASIVGDQVRVYRIRDLIRWESLGAPYTLDDSWQVRDARKKPAGRLI